MIGIEREQEIIRRRILGQSLACTLIPSVPQDIGRDLILEAGSNGLDFARVKGMDNLGQALSVALTTALGSDIFNTAFGFDGIMAIAEESDPVLLRERIRIGIIRVLQNDPRVRRIVDVKLGNGQLVRPAAGDRQYHVRVEFETRSGERASLDLGEVDTNV